MPSILWAAHISAWLEDTTGLPAQIVMQAPKRALLAATVPDAAIKVREF